MNERIEMLKEMVEKSVNPVGWIGYQEGHLVSFLRSQEQVNSFLTATDPTGRVEPVYTHPVKELTDEEIKDFLATFPIIFTVDDLCTFARAILRKAQSTCNGFCGEYECKENQSICKRKAQEK